MNENTSTLENDVKTLIAGLPTPVRTHIASRAYAKIVSQLLVKYHLTPEQANTLETELLLVIAGISRIDDVYEVLSNKARLSAQTIDSIITDLNTLIFVPLNTALIKEEELAKQAAAAPKAPAQPAPAVPPVKKAPPPPSYIAPPLQSPRYIRPEMMPVVNSVSPTAALPPKMAMPRAAVTLGVTTAPRPVAPGARAPMRPLVPPPVAVPAPVAAPAHPALAHEDTFLPATAPVAELPIGEPTPPPLAPAPAPQPAPAPRPEPVAPAPVPTPAVPAPAPVAPPEPPPVPPPSAPAPTAAESAPKMYATDPYREPIDPKDV